MLAIKDRVPPLVKTYKIPIKEKYSAAASAISFPKRERVNRENSGSANRRILRMPINQWDVSHLGSANRMILRIPISQWDVANSAWSIGWFCICPLANEMSPIRAQATGWFCVCMKNPTIRMKNPTISMKNPTISMKNPTISMKYLTIIILIIFLSPNIKFCSFSLLSHTSYCISLNLKKCIFSFSILSHTFCLINCLSGTSGLYPALSQMSGVFPR